MAISDDKVFITAVVSDDLKRWIQDRAKAQNRSLSNMVGVLLMRAKENEMRQAAQNGREIVKN
ncbi:MAG: hypothetical protein KDI79_15365 [Anaerolineae bacterium]|nr:hypothetical protein [Anaerolineae bacterium]